MSRFLLAASALALFAAGSAFAWKARAAESRIALKASIITRNDAVCLADFLPADVIGDPRALASQVPLGRAPLPGEHRTFDRAEVLRAIHPISGLGDLLELPPSLEVTRWARRLAPDEIARAIDESLANGSQSNSAALTPAEVELPPEAMVAEDAPQFCLLRVEAAGRSETRMQLWTVSEPGLPPFWVRVHRPISDFKSLDAGKRPAKYGRGGLSQLTRAPVVSPDASLVVKAGVPVEVIVQGRGMRIATSGVALSPGREGQSIRVRTLPAGKILLGVLDESGKVEINF